MPKHVEFIVGFDLPRNCTVAHAQETLFNEVRAMGGNLRPTGGEEEGDPMWEYDNATATIRYVRAKGKKRAKKSPSAILASSE
jgi:hypothetical protein